MNPGARANWNTRTPISINSPDDDIFEAGISACSIVKNLAHAALFAHFDKGDPLDGFYFTMPFDGGLCYTNLAITPDEFHAAAKALRSILDQYEAALQVWGSNTPQTA
jgi:hypothetical protein